MEINQKELLDKYGIDLSKGHYTIENINGVYKISTLRDDTSGCILVGSAIQRDSVLHSKATYQALVTQIKNALRKEKVFITVENIPQPIVVQIPIDTIPVNSLPVDVEKVIVKPDTVLTQIIEVPTTRKQSLIEKILAFILSLLKRK